MVLIFTFNRQFIDEAEKRVRVRKINNQKLLLKSCSLFRSFSGFFLLVGVATVKVGRNKFIHSTTMVQLN